MRLRTLEQAHAELLAADPSCALARTALRPAAIARSLPGHASNYGSSGDKVTGEEKAFSRDTAEKMGVSPRTVERHIQIAESLSPETKEILRGADTKITMQNLTKLSRLEPEQQTEAAKQLAGTIRYVDEYTAGTRQDNYYCTGAFIVDAFSEYNHTLCRILEACKSRFRDLAAKRVRPVKQLVGFTKIPLEPGEFDIFAGGNSRDCLNVRFTL